MIALHKAALALLPAAALLSACGPSGGQNGPTATPLSQSDLRSAYAAAATAYNTAETPVTQAENAYCDPAGPQADLTKCETALNQDRQATLTFDNAVRPLSFPAAARPDVTKLLDDDAQLERVLEQAATAPSLSAISALIPQIGQLLTITTQDADRVRADIGLPTGPASPSAPA
jgi:hypothetical protein